MHACMHACMYIYIGAKQAANTCDAVVFVDMHAMPWFLSICMDVYMISTLYVCMYACMHACMYVCMYVYTKAKQAELENRQDCILKLQKFIYMYIYIYIHAYIHTYLHTYNNTDT
jgi:hypothetical protein